MKTIKIQDITESAIIIALYVAITYIFAPFSYGMVQFRISEILVLLVLYKKRYAVSLIIGCFLANIGSSLGPWDMLFGTLATAIAIIPMLFIRNLYISSIFPVISNMLIVPFELGVALGTEYFAPEIFWFNVGTVALGEAVVLYALGIPFMLTISNNKALMNLLKYDDTCIKYKPKIFMEKIKKYDYLINKPGLVQLGADFVIMFFLTRDLHFIFNYKKALFKGIDIFIFGIIKFIFVDIFFGKVKKKIGLKRGQIYPGFFIRFRVIVHIPLVGVFQDTARLSACRSVTETQSKTVCKYLQLSAFSKYSFFRRKKMRAEISVVCGKIFFAP